MANAAAEHPVAMSSTKERGLLYPRKIAKLIQQLSDEKKGIDIRILDVRKISDITSYFVIVSGSSSRHVHALADHIVESTKAKGVKPWHVERDTASTWILIDHGDVITHVFYSPTRRYYNLERLWGDAPQVS